MVSRVFGAMWLYCWIREKCSVYFHTLVALIWYWPHFKLGGRVFIRKGFCLRQFLLGSGFLRVEFGGENRIGEYSIIQGTGRIVFGRGSFCGAFCVFGVNDSIQIGEHVMIADGVSIRDTDHVFGDASRPMTHQGIVSRPVVIEDDVWIGHGVTILKGVRVGRGSVIAAGAVVTGDVFPYSIAGGISARLICSR